MYQAWSVQTHDKKPVLLDMPFNSIKSGEVQVDVTSTGLNFADLLLIRGTYQDTPPLPFTLGLEFSGIVTQVAPDVISFKIGDRVAGYTGHGGLATHITAPADRCVKVPDTVSLVDAAGMLITYGTSHLALIDRAILKSGERLLVSGASGGVGLTAVEIGVALGAEVIAVARGAEKCATAAKAGAHHTIDSDAPDLIHVIRAIGRCDVVYDAVGGDFFTAALRCVAPEARILTIGFASGDVPQIKANHVMVKNVSVMGVYWGGVLTYAPEKVFASIADVFQMVADGKLNPAPHHLVPFADAMDGLDLLRDRKSTGKVVVTQS
ncbi:MAG: NADPH:quinone oxidoreductase family protein [Planktomarina sp.]